MKEILPYPVYLSAAFVALDIAGEIDWSVWWLVSPILIGIAIALLGVMFGSVAAGLGGKSK